MILHGDNLKLLPCVKDESVDLVLTDPPYALVSVKGQGRPTSDALRRIDRGGFMGKEWDSKLPGPEVWRECYRVLKPGGFILVMASPRNDDLVSVSLREAGFIKHNKIPYIGSVPAQMAWLYASGFPKGCDVGKAIDAQAVREWLSDKDHGLTAKEVSKVVSAAVNGECVVKNRHGGGHSEIFPEHNTNNSAGARLIEQLEERFGEMPKRVKVGEQSRCIERPITENWDRSTRPRKEFALRSQDVGGLITPLTAPATPLAEKWEGFKYGVQHLKPSAEIILVFQKSYDGRPLDSIIKWGVGAVNVDGGRIGTPSKVKPQIRPTTDVGGASWSKGEHVPFHYPPDGGGRYPSNFILSHAPGCVVVGERRVKGGNDPTGADGFVRRGGIFGEGITPPGKYGSYADADGKETVKEYSCVEGCPVAELDRQSGESPSNARANKPHRTKKDDWVYDGGWKAQNKPFNINDTGTASRFFYQPEWGPADFYYCAKASSAERNLGTENGSDHPTVKPIELARYLIRLYSGNNETPIILDPFAGSGWVEIAGILEGVKTLSMEAEWEYCIIAEARSLYWIKNKSTYLTEGKLPKYRASLPLFERG